MTLFRMDPDALVLEPGTGAPLSAALAWAAGMPGEVVRATRILLLPDEAAAERIRPQLGFTASDLVSCHIGAAGDGAAPGSGWISGSARAVSAAF